MDKAELMVYCDSLGDFRLLLKTLYDMGYSFHQKRYMAIWLWIGWTAREPINGIAFYLYGDKNKFLKYFNSDNFPDEKLTPFNEFQKILHGEI